MDSIRSVCSTLSKVFTTFSATTGLAAFSVLEQNAITLLIIGKQLPHETTLQLLIQSQTNEWAPYVVGVGDNFLDLLHDLPAVKYAGTLNLNWRSEDLLLFVRNACKLQKLERDNIRLGRELKLTKANFEKQIFKHTEQLVKKGQHVEESLFYARGIQRALLPLESYLRKHLPSHFVLYKPRDIVSGDFYWAQELDMGEKFVLAVGDCTGHGVPGALLSMLAMKSLDEIVREDNEHSPAKILQTLHNHIRNILKQNVTGNVDGLDIAVILWDKLKSEIIFAGAKIPIYLRNKGEMLRITGNKYEIGGVKIHHPRTFEEQRLSVDEGDLLYILSDGYVDQFGGFHGQKFMNKRLMQILEAVKVLPLDKQKEILWNRIHEWMKAGEEKQLDDIVFFGLRF